VRARGGPSWWGEVDPESTPPVAGYVETRARPGAERVLETEDDGHPLLASWRYGLGRVSALTTEPTGPGTEPWRDWDGYGELLGRVLARTAADTSAPFVYEIIREPGGACLVAERRAAAVDLMPSAERVAGDGSANVALAFQQVSPDRFEVRLPLGAADALRVMAGAGRAGAGTTLGPRTRLALDPLNGDARELQVSPDVVDRLVVAVGATGGETWSMADAAAAAPTTPDAVSERTRLRELGPLFALLALLAYLVDVTYRRWPRRVSSIPS